MVFVKVEDVGTTPRSRLTPHRRLKVWERTSGQCVVCHQQIDGVRERWIVEHIRALELGGADEPDNMGPAHETCAAAKTRNDHHRAAKAKRQKIQHLGAAKTKNPLPCGRQSRWKKKIDGTIVPRK
jgi:5-methylcytosine-specific restriction endonuclease McrA